MKYKYYLRDTKSPRNLENFRYKTYIKKFYSCIFFQFFGHQNPGFGTGSGSVIRKNAGSGSTVKAMRIHNPGKKDHQHSFKKSG